MGAAKKKMLATIPTRRIPTTILAFIHFSPPFFFARNIWLWRGLDVGCNEVFQILKRLIRNGQSLSSTSETCVPKL